MNPIIEFCINNLVSGSQEVFDQLARDPDLDVVELGCTSHCALCSMTLFALVEGECVTGETPEQLLNNIYKHLDENPIV
ncbi:YuzB family protein [Tenuibacillus multivorans]|uniref:Uncharacterized protein YuzB, UPF0349 family n=1 Tax=Tenuibacillus multivorans TaxID=237069 RepID=A0A1H0FTQ3_9BACI|nr:YuzB family protein [Tenuibacillus multivorans]GEL77890.1 UPF0349 protein [Tenuibacillus multivorans]SDN97869.1 Uncharacterized protein YuzB, UPF0349 family [Tenuibacillus multivorans]